MPIVRGSCSLCGDVILSIKEVSIDGSRYFFRCPCCEQPISRPASARILRILRAAGAPDKTPEAPPFTSDDLLDFHLALEREDWWEELQRSIKGA